jgi:hypothetical protein
MIKIWGSAFVAIAVTVATFISAFFAFEFKRFSAVAAIIILFEIQGVAIVARQEM